MTMRFLWMLSLACTLSCTASPDTESARGSLASEAIAPEDCFTEVATFIVGRCEEVDGRCERLEEDVPAACDWNEDGECKPSYPLVWTADRCEFSDEIDPWDPEVTRRVCGHGAHWHYIEGFCTEID